MDLAQTKDRLIDEMRANAELRAERDEARADLAAMKKLVMDITYYHHDGYDENADECPACKHVPKELQGGISR